MSSSVVVLTTRWRGFHHNAREKRERERERGGNQGDRAQDSPYLVFKAKAEEYFQRYPSASADMEAASLAHGVASPLSPREGMIKNVSLESLQLCERDGKNPLQHTEWL